jgi:hypothetical protein
MALVGVMGLVPNELHANTDIDMPPEIMQLMTVISACQA